MKKILLITGLLFIMLPIQSEEKGLFGPSKPKPGDQLAPIEEVLDATEKSYQIVKDTEIKTDKGTVKFLKNNFYIVSQDYISQNDKNQNELILMLQRVIDLKKQNNVLIITTTTCSILCIILFIFNIVLLKRRTGI